MTEKEASKNKQMSDYEKRSITPKPTIKPTQVEPPPKPKPDDKTKEK